MLNNPFQLVESREVYRNPWVRVREDRVTRPDGSPGVFGIVEVKPGATVLAIDEEERVVLVREHKYGLGRESIELISGGIEPGETPLEAARRELREETGIEASDWNDLGHIDPFTTFLHCPNYLFVATGLTAGESAPELGEHLEVIRVPVSRAIQMAIQGEITHGASSVLLLKWAVSYKLSAIVNA